MKILIRYTTFLLFSCSACFSGSLFYKKNATDYAPILYVKPHGLVAADPAIKNELMWPVIPYGLTPHIVYSGDDYKVADPFAPDIPSLRMFRAKEDAKLLTTSKQNVFGAQLSEKYVLKYFCWLKADSKTKDTVAVFRWSVDGKQTRITTRYLGALSPNRGYPVGFEVGISDWERGGEYSFHVFELSRNFQGEYSIISTD